MIYRRFNVLDELSKMSKGLPTVAPQWLVADCAFRLSMAGLENKDVAELERLYRLPDARVV